MAVRAALPRDVQAEACCRPRRYNRRMECLVPAQKESLAVQVTPAQGFDQHDQECEVVDRWCRQK